MLFTVRRRYPMKLIGQLSLLLQSCQKNNPPKKKRIAAAGRHLACTRTNRSGFGRPSASRSPSSDCCVGIVVPVLVLPPPPVARLLRYGTCALGISTPTEMAMRAPGWLMQDAAAKLRTSCCITTKPDPQESTQSFVSHRKEQLRRLRSDVVITLYYRPCVQEHGTSVISMPMAIWLSCQTSPYSCTYRWYVDHVAALVWHAEARRRPVSVCLPACLPVSVLILSNE